MLLGWCGKLGVIFGRQRSKFKTWGRVHFCCDYIDMRNKKRVYISGCGDASLGKRNVDPHGVCSPPIWNAQIFLSFGGS